MSDFVNLRMSSHFALEDNLLSIDDIIKDAKDNGYKSVSYTNKGSLFGVLYFYKKAISNGLKPIIGMDSYIENDLTVGERNVSRILMIAKNEEGYSQLVKLTSKAALENVISGKLTIKESWLKGNANDIIALSGEDIDNLFFKGFENRESLDKNEMVSMLRKKSEYIEQYKELFPSGFFLEIVRTGREVETNFIRTMLNLSLMSGTPTVATQSALFKERKDYASHLMRSSLLLNQYVDAKGLLDEYGRGQYLLNEQEMRASFKDLPDSINHAEIIGKMSNVRINLTMKNLPDLPTPNGESQAEYLRIIAKQGLEKKLTEYFPNEEERELNRKVYTDRMNYELDIINSKNFSNYFLIMSHLINKVKDDGISVGLGRGSAVGSLITTLVGITDVDPIKYGLYFERFLNPERNSMPDIDVDFPQSKRRNVIQKISSIYNKDDGHYVAQIGTFNIYKIKSAMASVFKLNSTHHSIQNIFRNALFDFENTYGVGKLKSVYSLVEHNEKLREEYENNYDVKMLVSYINDIIDSPANVSRHASGVVISNKPLENYVPMIKTIQGDDEFISTQYDKDELESANIIKFDILGLKNLDFMDEIIRKINVKQGNKGEFDINKINYEDPQVISLFASANTGGVFQFESELTKQTLLKLKPDSFDDIIAANALIRPSAKEQLQSYVKTKVNKEKVNHLHPLMAQITDYTYGVMIYQEQAMQTAQLIAGYSLGEGEILRRAMSKKDEQTISKQRERFIQGAKEKNKIEEDIANKIFDNIQSFAEYGFNKAHAVSYSFIAYRNAYLKHYHKTDFFLTLLEQSEKKDMQGILPDLYSNGFKLRSPDINECSSNFVLSPDEKHFTLGLANIKDINEIIANKIIKARKDNGDFTDIYDFCDKVGREDINKTLLENLIYAGCFDKITPYGESIAEKRSILIANIDDIITYSAKKSRVKKEKGFILSDLFGQEGLFKNANKNYIVDVEEVERGVLKVPKDEEGNPTNYIISEKDLISKEINVSGVSLRIDPLEKFKKEMKLLNNENSLLSIDEKETNKNIFHGLIISKKERVTKKGNRPFLIVSVSDGITNKDLMIFDEKQISKFNSLSEDDFISFKKNKKDNGFLNIDAVYDWNETKDLLTKNLNIAVKSDKLEDIKKLMAEAKTQKGSKITLYVPETIIGTDTYAVTELKSEVLITNDFKRKLVNILGGTQFIHRDYNEQFVFSYNKKNEYTKKKNNGFNKNFKR